MCKLPLFSFVMPAYKAEFIKESIDSILGQTYANLELVIVDDCSPEPIGDIVKLYDDKRVSYYRNKENIGEKNLVAQWNKCLSYAKGEWVILATDDDVYEITFLETFMQLHEKYPNADLFRGRICWIDEKSRISYIERNYESYMSHVQFYYQMMDSMKGGVPEYIFKREKLVENCGFVNFPKAWGSDDATAIMMSENGVLFSEKPLVSFRWSGQNISTCDKYAEEKVQARILYSKWMLDNKPNRANDDEFEKFYFDEIGKRLLTMLKVHLLVAMNNVPYFKRLMSIILWLRQLNMFGAKDKLSIVARTLLVN